MKSIIHLPTLRQLRYLSAVAEFRHFGRAAEACLVTQSTLSAGIRELETLLGATLVERTKRRVAMTPLGERIVTRARTVLAEVEDIVDTVRAAGEPLSGPLRLGVIPTIGPYLLPGFLPALRAAYPRLEVSLREDLTGRLLDRLSAGGLDVVLLALPYEAGTLETAAASDDPFWLACPPDHRLAEADEVTAADLAGEDLLLLEDGHCLRDHALAACHLKGKRSEEFEATSLHTIVQMVAGGIGVTLVPKVALDAGILVGTGLVAVRLAGPASWRRLGFAWRRSSPRRDDLLLLADFLNDRLAGSGGPRGAAATASIPPSPP